VQARTEVVGIDEGQFLGDGLIDVCMRMADAGKRVIVTGLDTDYLGRPFDPMPRLLAVAEEITKLLAICVQCGNPAVHTQRLVASEDLIVVGAAGCTNRGAGAALSRNSRTRKLRRKRNRPRL